MPVNVIKSLAEVFPPLRPPPINFDDVVWANVWFVRRGSLLSFG